MTSIIAMLTALGYETEPGRDDYRPYAIHVIAHADVNG